MLKAAAAATTVLRACVKDALKPKLQAEAASYYSVRTYASDGAGGAKEVSKETFGSKE
eukprot:CAMPEP_0119259240 /NCGR_PEP_ID=MMETSP1329-20130426/136_1 /TAXON_ID=114041 /ORGANISM="Genus nov. species nov., Strain RCC1024" /LENGTH=57 /DNA_ID=CAMNT_0007258605 /DNA_START=80 /DNA_END=253 /DNA_ORIENTATION=-